MDRHSYFESLGRFLRERRVEAGLTQAEVSEALGYSNGQFLSNIERGLCSPPMPALATLLRLYKIPQQQMTKLLLRLQKQLIEHDLKKAVSGEGVRLKRLKRAK